MSTIKTIIAFMLLATIMTQLVDQTKYKPYVSLVVGIMLIAVVAKPLFRITGNDFDITNVLSTSVNQETDFFEEKAIDKQEKQIKNQIERILKQEEYQVQEVEVDLENGRVKEIEINIKDPEKKEKNIKRILRNVYNIKNDNINISE